MLCSCRYFILVELQLRGKRNCGENWTCCIISPRAPAETGRVMCFEKKARYFQDGSACLSPEYFIPCIHAKATLLTSLHKLHKEHTRCAEGNTREHTSTAVSGAGLGSSSRYLCRYTVYGRGKDTGGGLVLHWFLLISDTPDIAQRSWTGHSIFTNAPRTL